MSNLTVAQMLGARKRPQTSIPICLRLDVMAEIEELERQIQAGGGSSEDDVRIVASNDADAADRIEELESIAREYTIDLRIEALDRKVWAAKVAEFTEEDSDGDKVMDMQALIDHVLRMPGVVASPEMTAGELEDLISGLSDGQWERVMKSVFDLNRRTVTVGKSLTASLAMRPKKDKPAPDAQ